MDRYCSRARYCSVDGKSTLLYFHGNVDFFFLLFKTQSCERARVQRSFLIILINQKSKLTTVILKSSSRTPRRRNHCFRRHSSGARFLQSSKKITIIIFRVEESRFPLCREKYLNWAPVVSYLRPQ